MKLRVIKAIALVSLTTILMSCNDNSSSKSNNSGYSKLTIPKKIDIETPMLLKQTRSKWSQKEEIVADAYQDLKESISQLEQNKQTLKIDLILLNQLTDEINRRCRDIPLNTPCIIEENQLHFTYNDEVIEEVVKLMGEESREHIVQIKDKKIPLGELKFTKYPDSQNYQYQIDFEYLPDIKRMIYTNESVKWSQDEGRVYSFYSSTSDKDKYSFGVDFSKGDNGTEKMVLDGTFYGEYDISGSINSFQSRYKFEIEKQSDPNHTFNILFSNDNNFTDDGEVDNYFSITTGHISDLNASLLIVSKNGDGEGENREWDIFDGNGTLISSKYCNTNMACDLDNRATWVTYNEDDYEGDEIDILLPPDLIELNITDGNLKMGDYLILPPNSDIDGMSEDEVFELSIGSISISKYSISGFITDKNYADKLDKVVIVYENIQNGRVIFEVIKPEDRPTLRI